MTPPPPHFSPAAGAGRIRVNSESHASTVSRDEELQAKGEDEAGTPTDGAPFRGRSKSAPPALWAAKKYGRQLRRMSDEFDSLLDKGVRKTLQSVDGLKRLPEGERYFLKREVEIARIFPPTYYSQHVVFFFHAGNEEDKECWFSQTDAPLSQLVELPLQSPGAGRREQSSRKPHASYRVGSERENPG